MKAKELHNIRLCARHPESRHLVEDALTKYQAGLSEQREHVSYLRGQLEEATGKLHGLQRDVDNLERILRETAGVRSA